LGHNDLHVTTEYLNHLGSHDLPDRIRKIGPVLEKRAPREELGEVVARLSDRDVEQLVALLRRGVPA
jgi:hypothetical protein